MVEASPALENPAIADGLTEDRWLGGRLALVQPRRGHRVGTDAALLAAAAGTPEGRIADVGAGVGAVGLALIRQSAGAFADLIEVDPELARLAGINAARNGLEERARVLSLDVLKPRERREAGLPTKRPIASSPTRRSSRAGRFAPLPTQGARGRMSSRRRKPARGSRTGFGLASRSSRPAGGS